MTFYDYLQQNYGQNRAIIASELQFTGISAVNMRQQLKKLTDSGKLKRYDTGIYFIPAPSRFKFGSTLSRDDVVRQKFICAGQETFGYETGLNFANRIGITTQVPATIEIATNKATTEFRRTRIAGQEIILKRPKTAVTYQNFKVLQLLDLISDVEKYTELSEAETSQLIIAYIKKSGINFSMLDEYLKLYPEKIYKNLYRCGVLQNAVA